MMFPESISKEAIQELPLKRFEGKIEVIDTPQGIGKAIRALEGHAFIGFDTEKKPTFRKGQYHPTALVQLSTPDEAFLFRINKIGIPDPLKKILESVDILKVGIGIRDDLIELKQVRDFDPGGFVELNTIAPELGIRQSGLRNLAAIFLDFRISKNQQTSNWENGSLTKSQQQYAATDAWVCGEIYSLLSSKGYIES